MTSRDRRSAWQVAAPEQCEIVRPGRRDRGEAGRKRVDALTRAVPASAFRGELVPTEAELASVEGRAYEPTSALLARPSMTSGFAGGGTYSGIESRIFNAFSPARWIGE